MSFLFNKNNHFNLGNIVTFFNIASGIFAIYFLTHHQFFAAALFAWLAGGFDIVDGKIARKYNLSTKFGSEFSNYVDFGKKTAQYNAGTGIDKIIDSLLINTSHVQITMQQSTTPDSTPKPITATVDKMKKLWRIITETRPVAFDRLRQQPALEIVYYIVEYDLGVVDVTAAQTGQTAADITASKIRMAEYARKKILNKKYNYIFTGLNDQIIKFDLDLNFAFVSTKARFDGAYYDSFITTPGIAVKRDLIAEEQRVKKIVRDTISFIHNFII